MTDYRSKIIELAEQLADSSYKDRIVELANELDENGRAGEAAAAAGAAAVAGAGAAAGGASAAETGTTDTAGAADEASRTSAGEEELPVVARSFLACLESASHHSEPFDFWLLENALPEGYCEAIASLPFRAPTAEEANFDGRRNTNDDLRVYFNPENQEKFPVLREIVDGFDHPAVRAAIERVTGTDLTDTHLRIEYCQDTPGFWLEPHTDIFVKKFTMLVYLLDDPELAGAGTDIHKGPPDHEYVTSAPYGLNKGVIFIAGENSWHAVGPGKIPEGKVRKSIIINFVTSEWRDKWELARAA